MVGAVAGAGPLLVVAMSGLLAGCGSHAMATGGTVAPSPASSPAAAVVPVATVNMRPDAPSPACTGLDTALPAPAGPGSRAEPRRTLPGIELPCLGPGAPVRLADLRGPAVLNVWASWCGPCAAEIPFLVEANRELGSRVRFVGVDLTDEPPDARAWNAFHDVGWPSLRDPDGAIRGPLRVPGPPVTFFIRSDGTLAAVHYGAFTSADEVREAVAKNLGVVSVTAAKGNG